MQTRRNRRPRRPSNLPAATRISEAPIDGTARLDHYSRAGLPVPWADKRYRGLSIGSGFDHRRFDGTVHSVFARALNFQLEGDRLVALVTPDLPDAPATIRADFGGVEICEIAVPGDVVACRAGLLRLGSGSAIDLRSARRWKPKAPSGRPIREAWRVLYRLAAGAPAFDELTGWLGLEICGNPGRFADRNGTWLTAALEPLAGRGPGLTPAGDDFIAGLAVALHWSGNAALLAQPLAGWAAHTTDVSRWLLLDSSSGRINAPICEAAAFLHGNPPRCRPDAALKLGHTSGLAMILGLLAGYAFVWPNLVSDAKLAT